MPNVPKWFEQKLKGLDSRLRVRWSQGEGVFFIEEKLPTRKHLSPEGAKNHEDRKRRSEGYSLVLGVYKCDWRAFAHLYFMDVSRFRDAGKYCDWLEEQEAHENAEKQRASDSKLDDTSHEAFDRLLWQTQNPGKAVNSSNKM